MNRRSDIDTLPLRRQEAAPDRDALAAELRAELKGEVRFDDGSRALYATDGSNYREVPIGVVLPRDTEDVVRTVALCRRYRAPILARGAGTSLAGQCCNVAVVLDFSRYMNRIIEIDPQRRTARVQPGVILDHLRNAAEQHHLTFAPDPATHNHNTLGGMIGNNSCGIHSVMGGRTADNIIELDILLYDGTRLTVGETSPDELQSFINEGGRAGEIYARLRALRDRYADEIRRRYPDIPRRVSGFNLDELLPEKGFNVARALVGSECTCAIVLEAKLRLVPSPPARVLLVLGYPDVYHAADHVLEVMAHGPVGLEGLDERLIADMKKSGIHPKNATLLPEGGGWLLVEFGGDTVEQAQQNAQQAMEALKQTAQSPAMQLYVEKHDQERVWAIRESGLGATAHVPEAPLTWPGWEDSAVPPARLGEYLRALRKLLEKYGYGCDLYGHFGQGCVHTRIDFDLQTADGIKSYRAFAQEAADLVVRLGGSFSGEHGDGQARGELLPKMYGNELVQAFRDFKRIWDPDWKMNPGKVIDPWRMDQNLRLGTGFDPPQLKTVFRYPADQGDFARAMLRCVGVGKCRREEGGTMCPSYMVTREEQHSTRGRARLLFEMMQGEVLTDGWHSEAVKDALNLCLSCKGCRGECPVNVDMATYKAEFMHKYYQGRWRPRQALFFGNVDRVARLASRAPKLANFLTQTRGLSGIAKRLAGIAPARTIPPFASETFTHWFARRERPRRYDRPPVILWPDTFNNHYHPQVARAAVEVLEAAGFAVTLPPKPLCCGRPLYEFGMLERAQKLLRETLDALHDPIRDGIPVVALEPACASVFRVELGELFPHDRQATRLKQQTFLLAEFLRQKARHWQPPPLARKAVVHLHCNHKAVLGQDADRELLRAMGLDFEILDSGCCGMAGSFGFEKDKYDVSIACGERVLLPAVRNADADTLILSDGYSCREQIAQCTRRPSLHLAEVLAMALREGG